jgi:hypothetical protein
VGDEDHRGREFFANAHEELLQALAHEGVEGTEGLVEEQHIGFSGEGSRQADALLLTAGEFTRHAAAKGLCGQFDEFEELVHARGLTLR